MAQVLEIDYAPVELWSPVLTSPSGTQALEILDLRFWIDDARFDAVYITPAEQDTPVEDVAPRGATSDGADANSANEDVGVVLHMSANAKRLIETGIEATEAVLDVVRLIRVAAEALGGGNGSCSLAT
jgi:hypothetical protein